MSLIQIIHLRNEIFSKFINLLKYEDFFKLNGFLKGNNIIQLIKKFNDKLDITELKSFKIFKTEEFNNDFLKNIDDFLSVFIFLLEPELILKKTVFLIKKSDYFLSLIKNFKKITNYLRNKINESIRKDKIIDSITSLYGIIVDFFSFNKIEVQIIGEKESETYHLLSFLKYFINLYLSLFGENINSDFSALIMIVKFFFLEI